MWADHLSIARCCAYIAELDLTEATVMKGAGLHLLQHDLLLKTVRVELEQTSREAAALL